MIIEKVSATVRYSQQLKNGSWKSIELSAEGTIDALSESWQEAQSELYDDLGKQLQEAWNHKINRKQVSIQEDEDSVLISEFEELLQAENDV